MVVKRRTPKREETIPHYRWFVKVLPMYLVKHTNDMHGPYLDSFDYVLPDVYYPPL